MNILLTGYSGNIGYAVAQALAPHKVFALVRHELPSTDVVPSHVTLVRGSLENLPHVLQDEIEGIVHAAASTAFRAPLEELRTTNVEGTELLLTFAKNCPKLRKFVHLSTTCVCGTATGQISAAPISDEPTFVNPYERSKWEAERVVLASDLPTQIARLSIIPGSEQTGAVRRMGAIHHLLYWLFKGLIPMLPGHADSRVDLISTEFSAAQIVQLFSSTSPQERVLQICAGDKAPRLDELLNHLIALFTEHHRGWANGSLSRPEIVGEGTFRLFEASIIATGDALFRRVADDARSFLPGLLHPRTFVASCAAPPTDWRELTTQVVGWLLQTQWGRRSVGEEIV